MSAFPEIDLMTGLVFAGTLVAFASFLFAIGVIGADRARARIDRRLDRVGAGMSDLAAELAATMRKREKSGRSQQMDQWLRARLPRRELLEARLTRTGRNISLAQYVSACIGVAAGMGVLLLLFGFPLLMVLPAAFLAGVLLPHMWVDVTAGRRTRAFLAQFPDGIDQIVRGVRSGLPVGEAIAGIARELPDPISTEFQHVIDGVKLGRTLEEALWRTGLKLGIPEFNFLVISMVVQRETGGNLAETLENLSDIVRRRHQMQHKARAMSSEARASAMIVGSLPFILGVVLTFVNPEYMSTLYTDPRGMVMLGAALASQCFGFLVMTRMAKFEI